MLTIGGPPGRGDREAAGPEDRHLRGRAALSSERDGGVLKEISPGCSLEGLMLKLKLQYFGHLMRRVDSLDFLPRHDEDLREPLVRRQGSHWEGLGAGEGDDRG